MQTNYQVQRFSILFKDIVYRNEIHNFTCFAISDRKSNFLMPIHNLTNKEKYMCKNSLKSSIFYAWILCF